MTVLLIYPIHNRNMEYFVIVRCTLFSGTLDMPMSHKYIESWFPITNTFIFSDNNWSFGEIPSMWIVLVF